LDYRQMALSSKASAREVVDQLRRQSTKAQRDALSRYGIVAPSALGVSVGELKKISKTLGRQHALAEALWDTEIYEARMLAAFVGEPERVTAALMDRWCKDFDNWAVCDQVCFHLFDRTAHAWGKLEKWAKRKPEFEKRAAFALLWGLTVHDKQAGDATFVKALKLIESAASDDRHFVKKAVNMALRATGKRNPKLRAAAMQTAQRLASATSESAQWVGRDALKELGRPAKPKPTKTGRVQA
jgi:3-methyladenine DNA glycosylase AlkD